QAGPNHSLEELIQRGLDGMQPGQLQALVPSSFAGWLNRHLPEGRLRVWVATRMGPWIENRAYFYRRAVIACVQTAVLLALSMIPFPAKAALAGGATRWTVRPLVHPDGAYDPLRSFRRDAVEEFMLDHTHVFYGDAYETRDLAEEDIPFLINISAFFARPFVR